MAKFELYQDAKGEYRWRLKAGTGQVIANGGEAYVSPVGASNAIGRMVAEIADAEVVDLTDGCDHRTRSLRCNRERGHTGAHTMGGAPDQDAPSGRPVAPQSDEQAGLVPQATPSDFPAAQQITRAWMAHLGYESEEIAEAEAEKHEQCDWQGDHWLCLNEDGKSLHPAADEMRQIDELVMFTLEHDEAHLRTIRERDEARAEVERLRLAAKLADASCAGALVDLARDCQEARVEIRRLTKEAETERGRRVVCAIFSHKPGAPRPFALYRHQDETGVSGTGVVATGAEFPDGTVALRWASDWPTSVVFHERGIESVEHVHGHGGKTRVVWLSEEFEPLANQEAIIDAARALAAVERGRSDATLDSSIWLEAHGAALAALVAAVDGQEPAAVTETPVPPRRGCPHPDAPGYDQNPTLIGEATAAYESYARSLDSHHPGWWDDDLDRMTPGLREIAERRRRVAAPSAPEADRG